MADRFIFKNRKNGRRIWNTCCRISKNKTKIKTNVWINFVKQYQVLPSEIANYNELVERVKVETLKNAAVTEEKK